MKSKRGSFLELMTFINGQPYSCGFEQLLSENEFIMMNLSPIIQELFFNLKMEFRVQILGWDSFENYLGSGENETWKKLRPVQEVNPWPLRYRCSTLQTELTSQLGAAYFCPFALPRDRSFSRKSCTCSPREIALMHLAMVRFPSSSKRRRLVYWLVLSKIARCCLDEI